MEHRGSNMSEIRKSGKVFYIKLPNNTKAYLLFNIKENVMEILETYTPPEYRGRGIASKILKHALEFAKEKNLKVRPICSYSIHFFIKHPEYRELLVEELKNCDLRKLFEQRLSEERAKRKR